MLLQNKLHRIFNQWRCRKLTVVLLLAAVLSLVLPADSQAVYFNHKLSGSMPDYGDVRNWTAGESAISQDGRYVVFVADRDNDEMTELYSVPLTGGEPVRLNSPLTNGGNVSRFYISPDSQWVVYMADQEQDGRDELYSVPVGGGSATKINAPLVTGGDVTSFRITPNSQGVVYLADQDENDRVELYSNYMTGGTPVT